MASGVASHRPPFGQKNSISGYNLFVSAYHGFAQLGNEHIPAPVMFEPFPIFSLDYLDCSTAGGGLLKLRFRLTLCGIGEPGRYRMLGRFYKTAASEVSAAGLKDQIQVEVSFIVSDSKKFWRIQN